MMAVELLNYGGWYFLGRATFPQTVTGRYERVAGSDVAVVTSRELKRIGARFDFDTSDTNEWYFLIGSEATMKGYTYEQWQALVTDVTIEMGQVREGLFNPNFVTACTMACAHESLGGKYRKQVGGGPGTGVLQIEKPSHDDVWKHSDTIHEVAEALGIKQDWSRVENDDRYSIFIMRHKFAMDSLSIPQHPQNIAAYVKRVWNGNGKATWSKYWEAYCAWKNGEL